MLPKRRFWKATTLLPQMIQIQTNRKRVSVTSLYMGSDYTDISDSVVVRNEASDRSIHAFVDDSHAKGVSSCVCAIDDYQLDEVQRRLIVVAYDRYRHYDTDLWTRLVDSLYCARAIDNSAFNDWNARRSHDASFDERRLVERRVRRVRDIHVGDAKVAGWGGLNAVCAGWAALCVDLCVALSMNVREVTNRWWALAPLGWKVGDASTWGALEGATVQEYAFYDAQVEPEDIFHDAVTPSERWEAHAIEVNRKYNAGELNLLAILRSKIP